MIDLRLGGKKKRKLPETESRVPIIAMEKQEKDEGMVRVVLVILLLLRSANFENNPRYALLFYVP